ncbi:MAG: hypothetical protein IJI75_03440 [Solobacterium sp.]|nr:hypothetical protein [Solobacterium sp.]
MNNTTNKYKDLPAEIRSGLFSPWMYKQIGNERKKIFCTPYGYAAKPNHPENWNSLDAALSCMEMYPDRYSGIGTLVTAESEVAYVDIDHCLDTYGNLTAEAQDIVEMLDSYTEYSPSYLGLHIAILVPYKGWRYDDTQYYMHGPSCELYTPGMTTRAMTVTAVPYGEHRELRRLTEAEMQSFLDTYMRRTSVRPKEQVITAPVGGNGMSWHDIFNILKKNKSYAKFEALFRADYDAYNGSKWIKNSTGEIDQSMYDEALCCLLAFWTGGHRDMIDAVFRRSALMREKWDRRDYNGLTYGDRTISAAIAKCENFFGITNPKRNKEGE